MDRRKRPTGLKEECRSQPAFREMRQNVLCPAGVPVQAHAGRQLVSLWVCYGTETWDWEFYLHLKCPLLGLTLYCREH